MGEEGEEGVGGDSLRGALVGGWDEIKPSEVLYWAKRTSVLAEQILPVGYTISLGGFNHDPMLHQSNRSRDS